MIKVEISKKDDVVCNIVVKGHACYDDYGKDIVCSSVSSIVITSVNAIMRIDKDAIACNKSEALIEINILKHDDIVDKLIINMLDLLEQLQKQYKNNIKICG